MYSPRTPLPGKQILRKGLSPLATTISTDTAAPVIAGMHLRAGKAASSKGAPPHPHAPDTEAPERYPEQAFGQF